MSYASARLPTLNQDDDVHIEMMVSTSFDQGPLVRKAVNVKYVRRLQQPTMKHNGRKKFERVLHWREAVESLWYCHFTRVQLVVVSSLCLNTTYYLPRAQKFSALILKESRAIISFLIRLINQKVMPYHHMSP